MSPTLRLRTRRLLKLHNFGPIQMASKFVIFAPFHRGLNKSARIPHFAGTFPDSLFAALLYGINHDR